MDVDDAPVGAYLQMNILLVQFWSYMFYVTIAEKFQSKISFYIIHFMFLNKLYLLINGFPL